MFDARCGLSACLSGIVVDEAQTATDLQFSRTTPADRHPRHLPAPPDEDGDVERIRTGDFGVVGVAQLYTDIQELLASQQRIERALASIVQGQGKGCTSLLEVQEDVSVLQTSATGNKETPTTWSGDLWEPLQDSEPTAVEEGRPRALLGALAVEDCVGVVPVQPSLANLGSTNFETTDTFEDNKMRPGRSSTPIQQLLDKVYLHMGLYQEEQLPKGELEAFVRGNVFSVFFAAVVLLECAFVCYSVDYDMAHIGEGGGQSGLIQAGQLAFILLYLLELVLKIMVDRMSFFCGSQMSWNLFDILLLGVSTFDLIASQGIKSATFIKAVRFVRVVRVLRVVRLVNMFPTLALICTSMLNSMTTLAYSVMLMAIVLYIFAILFVQGSVSVLETRNDLSEEATEEVLEIFGSVGRAMLHLYMACTNGIDWAEIYRTASSLGWIYAGFFLFFNLFLQITVLNIITSMFIERVMKQAQNDADEAKTKACLGRRSKVCAGLVRLNRNLGKNHNGTINEREFFQCCTSPEWKRYWEKLGLEVHDVENFFHMLISSTDSGEVDLDRFVGGCMKLSGSASSLDMQTLLFLVDDIKSKQKTLQGDLRKVQEAQGMMAKQLNSDGSPVGRRHRYTVSRSRPQSRSLDELEVE